MDSSQPGQLAPDAALLLIVGEPFSEEHKTLILGEITKGFQRWDVQSTGIDINENLAQIANRASLGEEGLNANHKSGERLIHHTCEQLLVEILINPLSQTVKNYLKKLLISPTTLKHVIYAGHIFQGSGAWVLQDDAFTFSSLLQVLKNIDVENALKQKTGSNLIIHTPAGCNWDSNLPKTDAPNSLRIHLNPPEKLGNIHGALQFTAYIGGFISAVPVTNLLQASEQFGNISFIRPTLYIFPGCQGDSALFGVSGFNLLVNGGYNRRACFWDFARHLDRIDAMMMTHLGTDSILGFKAVFERKSLENIHPQIGYLYMNAPEKSWSLASGEGGGREGEKKPTLLINLSEEATKLTQMARQLGVDPHPCTRSATAASCEPINLYHKLGHGTLDMYILNPVSDSKELKDFFQMWTKQAANVSTNAPFSLQNSLSICALLVWKPYDLDEKIVRIFFPGNAPQHKIIEGFEKIKTFDFLKHASCTARELTKATVVRKPAAGSKPAKAPVKLSAAARSEPGKNSARIESPFKEAKPAQGKPDKPSSPTKPVKSVQQDDIKKLKFKEKSKSDKEVIKPRTSLKKQNEEEPIMNMAHPVSVPSPVKGLGNVSDEPSLTRCVLVGKSASFPEASLSHKTLAEIKVQETSNAQDLKSVSSSAPADQTKDEASAAGILLGQEPESDPLFTTLENDVKAHKNNEAEAHPLENIEAETAAHENTEVETAAHEDTEVETAAHENTEVETAAHENTEVETHACENTKAKTHAHEDTEVETHACENAEVETAAHEDTEVKTQAHEDTEVKTQAHENTEVKTQAYETNGPTAVAADFLVYEAQHFVEAHSDAPAAPSSVSISKQKLQELGIYDDDYDDDEEQEESYVNGGDMDEEEKPQALPEPAVISESPALEPGYVNGYTCTVGSEKDELEENITSEEEQIVGSLEHEANPAGEVSQEDQQRWQHSALVEPMSDFETLVFTNDGLDQSANSLHSSVEQCIQYGIHNASHGRDMGGIQEVDEEELPETGVNEDDDENAANCLENSDDEMVKQECISNEQDEEEEAGRDTRTSVERQFEDVDDEASKSTEANVENSSFRESDASSNYSEASRNDMPENPNEAEVSPRAEDKDSLDDGMPEDCEKDFDTSEAEVEESAEGDVVSDQTDGADVDDNVQDEKQGLDNESDDEPFDPVAKWGQPMGLPSPPPTDKKQPVDRAKGATSNGLDKQAGPGRASKAGSEAVTLAEKSRASTLQARGPPRPGSAGKRLSGGTNKSSPLEAKAPPLPPFTPFYVDLTYVPNHADSASCDVEFFKRIRARYYVISSLSPNPQVLDSLLEAKGTWEQKSLETTIIPTYSNETLHHWFGLNSEKLHELRVDMKPAVSRCTIQLQDLETSLPAYRLEV